MTTIHERTPPSTLTDVGLNMFVDTTKLRELPLPVTDVEIEDLLWHLDMPVWSQDGTDDWNLKPQDVIDGKSGSSIHQRRTTEADLAFPIVITEYKSRLVILDGIHRLVKALQEGRKTIEAIVVPASYLSRPEFQA